MIYFGQLPLERPPASPAEAPARRRDEALKLIFNLFRSAPGDRYPPALNFAAYLYLAPEGPRQPAKARALLRKSAEAGDRLGMLNLARLYREGLGGPRDNLKAAHWARRAADAEPPPARALNEVGYFYETGRGVTRDLAEAKAWYEKSAGRGYAPGRTNAARLKGQGRDRPALDEDILF
jgi:TPR repeat protein